MSQQQQQQGDTVESSLSHYDYDYLVIGGGSGGVASARRAAMHNESLKIAIIEGNAWGGTCVNVGCVPKKIMYTAASLYETASHDAREYCILERGERSSSSSSNTTSKSHVLDWKALKRKRDAYIQRLQDVYQQGLSNASDSISVIQGWASFVDSHTVQVTTMSSESDATTNSYNVTARHILLAVGSKPMLSQDIIGVEHCITSDGFFDLDEQPHRVVVVGAGYIAVEIAGIFQALDSDTHLVVREERALRHFDKDLGHFLDRSMAQSGMHVHTNTGGVARVELHDDNKKRVTTVSGTVIEHVDCVILAIGREPNVHGLQLDRAGVALNELHHVVVDDYQTAASSCGGQHVYAVGDVCDKGHALTPVAIAAGRRLADRLFGRQHAQHSTATLPNKISYDNVPTVIFSHPPIGTVGLTEAQAVQKYGAHQAVKIYKSTFVNLYYSMFDVHPSEKPTSLVKLVCVGPTEQVVGLHICGRGADEMLQGFAVAIKMGACKADLDACIAIHPTAAEEVVTLAPWGLSPPSVATAAAAAAAQTTTTTDTDDAVASSTDREPTEAPHAKM